MASCVRKIRVKYYQNLIIVFQVTVENVGDVFGTQCTVRTAAVSHIGVTIDTLHLAPGIQ